MKLAIMQPYIFPYIGYFQLVKAVDTFILYDDVNYIKQGWIDRNRIMVNNEPAFFKIPIKNASSFTKISETLINNGSYKNWKHKFFKTLTFNYKKAPNFELTHDLIKKILDNEYDTVSELASQSIEQIASYLESDTSISISSLQNYQNTELKSQERILDICKKESAKAYINMIGGQSLYSKEDFAEQNIELSFLKTGEIIYEQFHQTFNPNLSIIDLMMFNDVSQIQKHLLNYELL